MDPQIITALINLIGGALGLAVIQGIIAFFKGHKAEAQKWAEKWQAERDARLRLQDALYLTRSVAIRKGGLTDDDLPPIPQP